MAQSIGEMSARLAISVEGARAEQQLKSVASTAQTSFASIAASAQMAGMALTAAGATILGALGLAGKAAIDAENAEKRLGVMFGENAQSISDYASKLQELTRFEDDSVKTAASVGATYMGLRSSMKEAMTAAANLAETTGMDLTTAMHALGKASGGQIGALSRMGVQVNEAAYKARGMAAVYEQVARETKNLAFANDSTSKTIDQMKNQFGDLLEIIGAQFQRSVADVAPLVKAFIADLQDFAASPAGQTAIKIAGGFGLVAAALGPVLIALPSVVVALANVQAAIAAVKAAAIASWAAVTSPVGLVIAGLAAVAIAVAMVTGRLNAMKQAAADQAMAARVDAEKMTQEQVQATVNELKKELEVRKQIADELGRQYRQGSAIVRGATFGAVDPQADVYDRLARQRQAIADLERELQAARNALRDMQDMEKVTGQTTVEVTEQQRAAWKAAAEERSKQITDAITGQRDYNDMLRDSLRAVADSQDAVVDTQTEIGAAHKAAAEAVADAQQRIVDAQQQAQKVQEDAAERIAEAEDRLADAYRHAAEEREDAALRTRRAAEDVLEAEQKAADAVKTAVERANEDVRRSQEKLANMQREQWMKQQPKFLQDYYRQFDEARRVSEAQQAVELAKRKRSESIAEAQREAGKSVANARERAADEVKRAQKALASAEESVATAQKAMEKTREQAAEMQRDAQQRIAEAQVALNKTLLDQEERINQAYERRAEALQSLAETVEQTNQRISRSYYALAYAQQLAGLPVSSAPPTIQGPAVNPVSLTSEGLVQRGGVTVNFNAPVYGEDHLRRLARDEVAGAVKSARYATWGG